MTSPSQDNLPREPHEGLDPADNAEARETEQAQTPALARSSQEGPPPTDAPPAGQAPEVSGTGAGDPLDAVRIDPDDADAAVAGDDGPEHPGVRRSS